MRAEIAASRHEQTANYLYADGNVSVVAEDTLHKWMERDIERVSNFARP